MIKDAVQKYLAELQCWIRFKDNPGKLFHCPAIHFNLILLFSILINPVLSTRTYSRPDSLDQYLEQAARNNSLVLQRYYEYQAALEKVPQAGALPDPELNAGVFLSAMELIAGNQVAEVQLMQMFPWFGTLRLAKDEMSLMANARFELARDATLQVLYDVQKTWYDLYKLQQNIRITEMNIDILHTIRRISLVKFSTASSGGTGTPSSGSPMQPGIPQDLSNNMPSMNGNTGVNNTVASGQPSTPGMENSMGSPAGSTGLSDYYLVQIEIGQLENNLALLKDQQNTLMARFNSYLNRPASTAVSIPDSLEADTLVAPLQQMTDSSLSANPMLAMIRYEKQSLESRRKMVTKMGYPMIGIGVNYSLISKSEMSASEMNGNDMIMPMIGVSLPIYRKKYKALRNEADLLINGMDQSYQAAFNNLKTEYFQAIQMYRDAERRVSLYADQSILVKNSLDIMLKSYASSGTGLTEVLRILQQNIDYGYRQAEAVADHNTAIALLKRLMALQQYQ